MKTNWITTVHNPCVIASVATQCIIRSLIISQGNSKKIAWGFSTDLD